MPIKRKFWLAVVAVVAIIVLIPFSMRWRAQWRLNAYRKQLMTRGEKLTYAELAPKRSEDSTNTAEFLKLVGNLWHWDPVPLGMHSIKPGVARVAWKEEECWEEPSGMNQKGPVDVWPGFIKKVQAQGAAPTRIGQLVAEGGVHFLDDVEALIQTPATQTLNRLAKTREAIVALDSMAILNLHQGN